MSHPSSPHFHAAPRRHIELAGPPSSSSSSYLPPSPLFSSSSFSSIPTMYQQYPTMLASSASAPSVLRSSSPAIPSPRSSFHSSQSYHPQFSKSSSYPSLPSHYPPQQQTMYQSYPPPPSHIYASSPHPPPSPRSHTHPLAITIPSPRSLSSSPAPSSPISPRTTAQFHNFTITSTTTTTTTSTSLPPPPSSSSSSPSPRSTPNYQSDTSTSDSNDDESSTDQSTTEASVKNLEHILEEEQSEFIQVRAICATIAHLTRDVLASGEACPLSFVSVLKQQLAELQKTMTNLHVADERKASFEGEFVQQVAKSWRERNEKKVPLVKKRQLAKSMYEAAHVRQKKENPIKLICHLDAQEKRRTKQKQKQKKPAQKARKTGESILPANETQKRMSISELIN